MCIQYKRGDVIQVNLHGAIGVEKKNDLTANSRPCVVVQNDIGNANSPLTIVAPITDAAQYKYLPIQVLVDESELRFIGAKKSVIECGHLRAIDSSERVLQNRGSLDAAAMERVDKALACSLGISSFQGK